ncbi:MFS transporter [Pullulanibacillus camelliae]|uniref:Putative proline/betaine transporter n=1 Tax=Pullulanibacillus camelliae TaxID=1707096 RepID=A0A8J2VK33_9BACL|nr:MFS transporter [Pullulanibacillus camelliae]GGE27747.1 MFS transporter [Pullulanibacillus camelliae]
MTADHSMRKVVIGSFIGALIEWYDFFLYGTAAALVFNKIFFNHTDPLIGTLLSLTTFAIGFISRPLGGIIFGHYGDKIGRKKVLIITILIMGLSTFLIGLMPSSQTIGIWAPILLCILRVLQGIGIGGEYGGAALMTIEHSPNSKRGFWASLPQSASPAGILLSTGMFTLVSKLPEAQFMSWGWRIPFLISIVLLLVGVFIRSNVEESPEFKKNVLEKNNEANMPVVEILRTDLKSVLITLGARFGEAVSSNIFNVFAIAYITTQLKFNTTVSTTGIMLASAISIIACPIFGIISDKIGRKIIYLISAFFVMAFAFPFFGLLNTKIPLLIALAIIIAYTFGPTMMFSVQSVLFAEQFDTKVRYTGLSIAYQFSSILGGLTPLIATTLLVPLDGKPWLVSIFLLIIGLISFVSAFFAKDSIAKSRKKNKKIA